MPAVPPIVMPSLLKVIRLSIVFWLSCEISDALVILAISSIFDSFSPLPAL